MLIDKAMTLWLAIDKLEAQETLLNFKIAEYSNMESGDKQKTLNEWKEKAYGKEVATQNDVIIKTSDIAKHLEGVSV